MKIGDLVKRTRKSINYTNLEPGRGIVLDVLPASRWTIAKVFWGAEYGTIWTPISVLEKIA